MKTRYSLILLPLLLAVWQLPAQLQVSFTPAAANMMPGEEREFTLVVNSGFNNLIATEFTITFDTNRLEYVNSWALVDTQVTFFGLETNYYDGKDPFFDAGHGIRVFWFDFSLNPKSLPNNTPFIRVRLRAKTAGISPLTVTCNANNYNCEILNQNEVHIGINAQPASITIGGGFNGLTATIASVTAPAGSAVCVPVTVNNFNDIVLMEFGLTWNASILSFTGFSGCNGTLNIDCAPLDPMNPSNNNFGFFNANTLTFSWFTPLGGVSLPNGTVLFELCFQVNGNMGQFGAINFFNNPNPNNPPQIEFRNGVNAVVPSSTIGGGVTIGSTKALTLDIGERLACPDDTICVPVFSKDFNAITGLQIFTITDPNKLKLVNVKGCNPKLQLSSCAFGGLTFSLANDTMTFVFIAVNPNTGVTLDSGEVLFHLCYENLMAPGDSVDIRFTDKATHGNPLLPEATDTSGVIGLIQLNGRVRTIKCDCNLSVSAALTTNVTCNGGTNGAINLIVNGGSGNFTYQWSPTLPNTKNPTGLSAGTYRVTILDNDIPNCQWTSGNINVTQPPPFNITGTKVNESCEGEMDGSITLSISGSNPGSYAVNWGGGLTGATITNLSAGNYTPTVTDVMGCTGVGPTFVVTAGSIDPSNILTSNVTCFGANNGSITLNLPSSGAPYTVTWLPASAGTGTTISNLGPGMYTPTIMSATGCEVTLEPINITSPPQIVITAQKTDVICHGSSTGSIQLTVQGGAGNFTYLWANQATTPNRTDLAAGTYMVTVTDQTGCTNTQTVTVDNANPAMTVSASTTNATGGQSNGSVTLTIGGGVPGYTYSWSNGATSRDLSAVAAGSYTVTVTDAAGCTRTLTATVSQADNNLITFQLSQFDMFNVSCHGVCDGTAVAFPPGSAIPPVTYRWSNSAGGGNSAIATNLCAGMHSITITDATGKVFTGSVTLASSQPWTVSAISLGEPPFAGAYVAVNGPFQQPYTFLWNTGDTTETVTNLIAGNYCVTVTNARGCKKSACVEIFDMDCLMAREVITPNRDGVNDEFVISCVQDELYRDHRLEIFNRWGQLVYSTTNYQNNWAGTTASGTELAEGVYFYVLEYTLPFGETRILKGAFNILR
jgi:gliding motility-associated-like protein